MTCKNLLAVSYAKQALVANSREQKRMLAYAEVLDQYHLVVFTRVKDQLPTKFQSGNLTVYGTNARTKIGMLFRAYQLSRQILKTNRQVSWVVSGQDPYETSLVGRWAARGLSVVNHVQIHGDNYSDQAWRKESMLNGLRLWYGKKVLLTTTSIRVVSERVKRSIVKLGVADDRVTVLPIAVALEEFLEVGERRSVNIKPARKFIFLGRFSPEKNLLLLLESFALVVKEITDVKLELVGQGRQKAELLEKVKDLGLEDSVVFTDWTDNVSNNLSTADVLVLVSKHEGYALVLIEAMAAGLPVVTTDVGCVGEFVSDGKEGRVVSDTKESIATGLLKYATDAASFQTAQVAAKVQARSIQSSQSNYVEQWRDSFFKES